MSTLITFPISTHEMFRENGEAEPVVADAPPARHWLLDAAAGRPLLQTALLKADRHASMPLFGRSSDLDERLDEMIDVLGLRDMPAPVGGMESVKTEFALMKIQAKVLFFGLEKAPSTFEEMEV